MASDEVVGYEFYRRFYADVKNRQVLKDGRPLPVPLTLLEFEVLKFYLENPRKLIPRNDVEPLRTLNIGRHPLDNYLSKMRMKMEIDPNELFVLTRRIGYTFDSDVRAVFFLDQKESGEIFRASEINFNNHTIVSLRRSLDQSLKALDLDPHGNPEAHTNAAFCYINLCHTPLAAEMPSIVMEKARWHANEALKIDPKLSSARGVLGLISLIYDYDWHAADDAFRIAVKENPKDAATLLSQSHLLISTGRFKEALSAVEQAVRADPTDLIVHASRSWMYLLANNIKKAIELGEKTKYLYPDFPPIYLMLGWIYEGAREYEKAERHYKLAIEKGHSPVALGSLGHLLGKTGRKNDSLETLAQLDQLLKDGTVAYVPQYTRALVFAGLNDQEACLDALEKAYLEKCDWLIHLVVERRWDGIRDHPKFRELVKKVNIASSFQN